MKNLRHWIQLDRDGNAYRVIDGYLQTAPTLVNGDIDADDSCCVSQDAFDDDELQQFFADIEDATGWKYNYHYKIILTPTKN